MPKSIDVQFREEKKLEKALEPIKSKSKFLKSIQEWLLKVIHIIKDVDRTIKK